MKRTDDMEELTPPLDCVGAKSPPNTDAERGASYQESPEQSVEACIFVAGTSEIFCPMRSGNAMVLISVTKLNMRSTNLKVEDDARPDDSMPLLPPSQATDDALSDESWPPSENVGIKPVGGQC